MRTTPRRRLAGALLASTIAFLAATPAASATYEDEEPDVPETPVPTYTPKPDLFLSNASIAPSSTGWQLSYTVKNNGDAPSGSFQMAVAKEGTTSVAGKSEAGLAAGSSRTSTINFARSTCYLAVKVTVDSSKVVNEASEGNNTTWLVGQAAETCDDAPKYKVQALTLKSVRQQNSNEPGTADEPYLTISRVSNSSTALTWRTPVYDNVVTGETVSIAPADGCIWSRSCTAMAAPHGIGFSVQAMEHDWGDLTAVRNTVAEAFDKAGPIVALLAGPEWAILASPYMAEAVDTILGWAGDDVVGSRTYAFSPVDLAKRLPVAGTSFEDVRTYSGVTGWAMPPTR